MLFDNYWVISTRSFHNAVVLGQMVLWWRLHISLVHDMESYKLSSSAELGMVNSSHLKNNFENDRYTCILK